MSSAGLGVTKTQTWHDQPLSEIARQLATDIDAGLSYEEVSRRLGADGPNELRKGQAVSPLASSPVSSRAW